MAKSDSRELEARIHSIVAEAAYSIAAAVREDVATQIGRIVSSAGGRAEPKRAGNHGTSVRAPRADGRGRARRGAGGPDAGLLDKLLGFIKQKPNLRSEEIRKQLGLDAAAAKAALAHLRAHGRVRTKGDRRTTTYTVA